ncbi:SGNH/GDSL hydrolase family protein [Candidatus Thorarchaeota archaeon]|nr:MAG: SGNH/GDSL hydrolase family protein [Candidatus Thorarchaeota archaeon]
MPAAKGARKPTDGQVQETWNLVSLGDSTPTGYGVGTENSYVSIYAKYIEEDLGIHVAVHNWATNETRTVADWAEAIRHDEQLREDLMNAQVITIWLGWHNVIPSITVHGENSSIELTRTLDVHRLREATHPMRDSYNRLLSEIVALAPPHEARILIADVGIPALFVRTYKEYGVFDEFKKHAYESWREYIIQSAGKYEVFVVHTSEVVNDPNHDQQMAPEYMQADGIHFNEAGHKLIAQIHREIGYECSRI